MQDKTIVIVGGTDGIGRALANVLVQKNRVLILGRSDQKGQDFVATHGTNASYLTTDLSVLNNLPPLVAQIKAKFDAVDFIVHTADILRIERLETSEGIEISIAINFYSRVLFNQLMLRGDRPYTPERIIHVAAAGFPPTKNFMNGFPLPPTANSFTAHKLGQWSNDFYGLHVQKLLADKGTTINILNPGSVATNIHKKGQLPFLLKLFYPIIGRLLIGKRQQPEDYIQIPLAILHNNNPKANQYTLIDSKGNGIKGNVHVNNTNTQAQLYEFAKAKINATLEGDDIVDWM